MSGQQHAPAALYPQERPCTHFTGGWVGPRADLDSRKSRPHRDSIPDRPPRSQSLYQLSYPAHVCFNNSLYIRREDKDSVVTVFFFKGLSLLLFTPIFILTTVSLVSWCKYLFKLVKGTILKLVLEHTVHTFCAINHLKKNLTLMARRIPKFNFLLIWL